MIPVHHAVLAAFAGVVFTGCQSSLPPPPSTFDDRFKSADSDGDSRLSREELADFMAYHLFHQRDLNRDGNLTLQEWWPGADEIERAGFDRRDGNSNGKVTLKEARLFSRSDPASEQTIRLADKDGDGLASWKEVNSYLAKRR